VHRRFDPRTEYRQAAGVSSINPIHEAYAYEYDIERLLFKRVAIVREYDEHGPVRPCSQVDQMTR
jgi:hypothetical protein